MNLLDYFDEYTENRGWEIIPILPKSKMPFMRGWNVDYDRDRMRSYLSMHLDCNIGLRLGVVIDVEADTERANVLLDSLIPSGYQHPQYRSKKSVHHLFLNPDPDMTKVLAHGIEFRGNLHQSLLPPSTTKDGLEYTWIEGSEVDVPALPEPLLNLYNRHRKVMRGGRSKVLVEPVCFKCQGKSRLHGKRYGRELAAFKHIGIQWRCKRCRGDIDVRPLCRKFRYVGLS